MGKTINKLIVVDGVLSFECKGGCGIKPVTEFYPDKKSNIGIRSKCKKCTIAQNTTPEALNKHAVYGREVRRKDPRVRMHDSAKNRAKVSGLPFTIKVEDIIITEKCPVFGCAMEVSRKQHCDTSPSLDKVIPELGYVPGNICVISDRANRIKRDSSADDIRLLISFLKKFKSGYSPKHAYDFDSKVEVVSHKPEVRGPRRDKRDKSDRMSVVNGVPCCQCQLCAEDKPTTEFYPNKSSSNGLRSNCKACQRLQNTTSDSLQYKREYNRKQRREDPRIRMYDKAKNSSKDKGLPFSIVPADIIIPNKCPVFNTPFELGDKIQCHNSPSLDRVVPKLGYVPGNIVVISDKANRAKRDATLAELESILTYIEKFQK